MMLQWLIPIDAVVVEEEEEEVGQQQEYVHLGCDSLAWREAADLQLTSEKKPVCPNEKKVHCMS